MSQLCLGFITDNKVFSSVVVPWVTHRVAGVVILGGGAN